MGFRNTDRATKITLSYSRVSYFNVTGTKLALITKINTLIAYHRLKAKAQMKGLFIDIIGHTEIWATIYKCFK